MSTNKIEAFGKNQNPPAVVLGLGVNGLGAVRSLGRAGIPVIGIYSRPHEAGRFSKYCEELQFPILEKNPKAFLEKLMSLGQGLNRPPLIPTSDEYLHFISHHRELLEQCYRFNLPDVQTLEMIIKKNGTQELAERCGVPIPKTFYPKKTDELEFICTAINFPCIIKPLDTFSIKFPDQAKNFIFNDAAQFKAFFQANPHCLGETVVQEIIRGGDGHIFVCAAYFDANSEPLAVYTGRKIRQYPPDYGVTCLGESIYLPELEETTVRFLKQIGFRGLVAAEFVKDRKTGAYYFIELNARSYYHNVLFTDCGVNLAYIAYCDLLGKKIEHPYPKQKEGIWWLDFQRDLSSCWRKHQNGEITWKEWLRTILQARSFAYFDRSDIKPFIYSCYLFLKISLQKVDEAFERLFKKNVNRIPSLSEKPKESNRNKSIRVMHVVHWLGLAGMEYGVIKLVNRLDSERFFPMICCLHSQREVTRSLLDRRVPVFELKRRDGIDWSIILKLAALLRQERVDIVHSHNWTTFFYSVLAAKVARVPVLIHGEHGRETGTISRRRLFLSRWLAKRTTHFVGVSDDLCRELVEQWKIRPDRVTAIANGVDLDIFGQNYDLNALRRALQLLPENRVVMNIGGLRQVKDHQTLLRAFAELYQEVPEARLLLVGSDHGKGIQTELEKRAEELGIRKAVYFVGIRHDIPQLLALCDVYVNTSLFEGMSNTILEAMASCRPVVATAVGGNAELVRDGVTGYLISPRDDQQLAKYLKSLLTDGTLAKAMGEAGRSQVKKHHAMAHMVQKNSDLYQEIWCRQTLSKNRSRHERIKGVIAHSLRWSGLNRIKKAIDSPQLTILTYHRVLPLDKALDYPVQQMMMPADLFEAQMAHLARHYTVLDFFEAIRLLKNAQLPKRAIVVTFDDGYLDNYLYAWPIMKKYNISATFFLVTGVLDRSVKLWWDEVVAIIKKLSRSPQLYNEHNSSLANGIALQIKGMRNSNDARTVSQTVIRHLNQLSRRERQDSLEALRAIDRTAPEVCSDLMLTWEQVRELQRSGMNIGAHTVTHAFLDELDEEGARREICDSVERLQERLNVPIRSFAYPRGRFMQSLKGLLQQAGIETAVTTVPGRNKRGADLFQLNRLDAGYLGSNGGFHPNRFDAELQGWFNFFRTV